jgi:hypothetical protein
MIIERVFTTSKMVTRKCNYSFCKAEIGSAWEALRAGTTPNINPITIENMSDPNTGTGEK